MTQIEVKQGGVAFTIVWSWAQSFVEGLKKSALTRFTMKTQTISICLRSFIVEAIVGGCRDCLNKILGRSFLLLYTRPG